MIPDTPDPLPNAAEAQIESSILGLTRERGPGKSICPSDVARTMQPNWQVLLPVVRRVAVRLALDGKIEITRKGRAIDPLTMKGVIRLRTVT